VPTKLPALYIEEQFMELKSKTWVSNLFNLSGYCFKIILLNFAHGPFAMAQANASGPLAFFKPAINKLIFT